MTETQRYVAYVHGERRGTILGQWVCVNPPSLGEFLEQRIADCTCPSGAVRSDCRYPYSHLDRPPTHRDG